MDQVGKEDAVPFCIPDVEAIEENESWSSSDKQSVVWKYEKLKIRLRRPLTNRKHLDDGYNLPVVDKGCALILSNKINRNGSEIDMDNLNKLFTHLGYKIYKYDAFYSDESDQDQVLRLSEILDNFKSKVTEDIKSIVVFVGSHGNFGSFQTSDGKHVDFLTELVYKFSHRSCPQLEGKPKIFLAQFCQNFKATVGKGETRKLVKKYNNFFKEKLESQKENDPTYIEDAIICYSAIPGFEAVRCKQIGSIFVHCFCKVVLEMAHKLDLWSMMHPVGEEMKKFYRQKYKITPSPTHYHAKKVYFNLAPELNMIPKKLDFYINRKLKTGNLISGKVLRHKCPDIFVLQLNKLGRVGLSNLLRNEVTVVSSDCKQFVPARFIVLEEKHHFRKICEKAPVNLSIHLLQETGENGSEWKWITSHGKANEIQKFGRKSTDPLKEATFLSNIYSSNLTQPICIIGRPGMGKSSLLAEIGRRLTIPYPDRLILFFKMKDFVDKVKHERGYNFEIKVNTTLRKLLRESHLDEEFDQIIYGSAEDLKFELLLDGFDESENIYLGFQILQLIRAYSSMRIWITSRPHFQKELERTLGVPAFTLAPFSEDDQIEFLSQVWSFSRIKALPKDQQKDDRVKELDKLKCFADYLLKSIKSLTKTSSRSSKDLASIPLQCMLIGRIYEDEAIEFLHTNKLAKHFTISSIGNLFQLYISKSLKKCENARVEEMHARLALEMYFGQETVRAWNLPLADIKMEDILKMGIVEIANNSPQFIHATFKDYFIAWYSLHMLQTFPEDNPKTMEFLTNYILKFDQFNSHCQEAQPEFSMLKVFGFRFPKMAYFFNFLLPHFTIQSSIQLEIEKYSPEMIHEILMSSIFYNHINILKFFNSFNQAKESESKIYTTHLLYTAAGAKCSLEFFKVVLAKFEKVHKLDLQTKEMLVILATQMGNYQVLEFLLNVRKLRFIVEKGTSPDIRLLLHFCVAGTELLTEDEISQRIEILQKIVSINKSLLEVRDEHEATPLLCDSVHIRLLHELIRLGANVLVRDKRKCNILHLSFNRSHLTGEDFHALVASIPTEKLSVLVVQKNSHNPYANIINREYMAIFSGETYKKMAISFHEIKKASFGEIPLMKMITRIEPLPETLEIYYKSGADFNCWDIQKSSVLAQALMNQRSGETILKLIELGAYVNWRGWNGESVLHVAAYWCNVDAIKVLVDSQFINVNDEDGKGRTPLDYTVESRHKNKNKAFLLAGIELCKRGGKLAHLIQEGKPWLHVAVEEADLDFLKLLLNFVDVNEQDQLGNTAIHALMLEWIKHYSQSDKSLIFSKILEELLRHKELNMEIQNNEGKTPFQMLSKIKRMNFELYKMFMTKAEMEWTRHTATLGLKCLVSASLSEYECLSGLKELEKYQPNFSFVDEEGNSLLHLCVNNMKWRDVNYFERQHKKFPETDYDDHEHLGRSWMSDLNLMKYLIRNGANVYHKNGMGLTFLHAFILEDPCHSSTDFSSLTNYLDKKGYLDLFNIPGGDDQSTPFQMAAQKVSIKEETFKLFKAKGVDFNAIDKNGDSVLFYAAKSNCSEPHLMQSLIKFGADWNHRNTMKESLLHVSAKSTTYCILPLKFILKELKLDMNEKNSDGNTPIHCQIIERGYLNNGNIQLLLKSGADITIKNNEGFTPVELAKNLKKDYFVKIFAK